jgi:hypothetical protein
MAWSYGSLSKLDLRNSEYEIEFHNYLIAEVMSGSISQVFSPSPPHVESFIQFGKKFAFLAFTEIHEQASIDSLPTYEIRLIRPEFALRSHRHQSELVAAVDPWEILGWTRSLPADGGILHSFRFNEGGLEEFNVIWKLHYVGG